MTEFSGCSLCANCQPCDHVPPATWCGCYAFVSSELPFTVPRPSLYNTCRWLIMGESRQNLVLQRSSRESVVTSVWCFNDHFTAMGDVNVTILHFVVTHRGSFLGVGLVAEAAGYPAVVQPRFMVMRKVCYHKRPHVQCFFNNAERVRIEGDID